MPVSFVVLKGLDYRRLVGPLGEGPLIRKFTGDLEPLLGAPKRVLSRHPFRGKPMRQILGTLRLLAQIKTDLVYAFFAKSSSRGSWSESSSQWRCLGRPLWLVTAQIHLFR